MLFAFRLNPKPTDLFAGSDNLEHPLDMLRDILSHSVFSYMGQIDRVRGPIPVWMLVKLLAVFSSENGWFGLPPYRSH